jgi:hypothetical protein
VGGVGVYAVREGGREGGWVGVASKVKDGRKKKSHTEKK